MMTVNAEGEQHGPRPNEGLDDDDFYLKFLRQVTHHPEDYHHDLRRLSTRYPPFKITRHYLMWTVVP